MTAKLRMYFNLFVRSRCRRAMRRLLEIPCGTRRAARNFSNVISPLRHHHRRRRRRCETLKRLNFPRVYETSTSYIINIKKCK